MLSRGDINGYLHTVNHPDYNVDLFLAILITGFDSTGLSMKIYLFRRHDHSGIEIDLKNLRTVKKRHPAEELLRASESVSLQSRSTLNREKERSNRSTSATSKENPFQQIRVQDKLWLSKKYPGAKLHQSEHDRLLYWRWELDSMNDKLIISYRYPSSHKTNANLDITFNNIRLTSCKIPLSGKRFQHIEKQIERALFLIKAD